MLARPCSPLPTRSHTQRQRVVKGMPRSALACGSYEAQVSFPETVTLVYFLCEITREWFQLFLLAPPCPLFKEAIRQRWFHTGKSPVVNFLAFPETLALCLKETDCAPPFFCCRARSQHVEHGWAQGVKETIRKVSSLRGTQPHQYPVRTKAAAQSHVMLSPKRVRPNTHHRGREPHAF